MHEDGETSKIDRRKFLTGAVALGAGATVVGRLEAAEKSAAQAHEPSSSRDPMARAEMHEPLPGRIDRGPSLPPGEPGKDYTPVVTPNSVSLPWKVVDGVKVYHLVAEEVEHEFAPGLKAQCWGYNGRVHGPTIEAVEGDRVRIYVTNKLAAGTSVHWHGLLLPNGMDGVGGLTQRDDPARRDVPLRVHAPAARHVHVSLAPRRDDADGAGHDGTLRHPPTAAEGRAAGPRLCVSALRMADRRRHRAPEPERDDQLQRLHLQREGLSRQRSRWSRGSATACASASRTSLR